jgi:PatG C-terminal
VEGIKNIRDVKVDESLNPMSESNSNSIDVMRSTDKLEGAGGEAGCSCGGKNMKKNESPTFIYAIGSIRVEFSNPSLKNEFIQAMAKENTQNMTEKQSLYNVIKNNRYIAREACWIFSVEKVDCYVLVLKDPYDLDQLVETINPEREDGDDINVVIGQRGPIAPIEMCGFALSLVMVDKFYSFARKELIEKIPKPENVDADSFKGSSGELFNRIQQLADNVGATDSHRALNYIAVRYPQIYVHTNRMHAENCSLTNVEVIPSRLTHVSKLVDVLFTYVHRSTQERRKFYLRVDASGRYPYLHSPLTQYFDRV